MNIIRLGIHLARNIFALHGVDENGKAVLIKPKVLREQLLLIIEQLPPCLFGMEACSGTYHWAGLFRSYGQTVKLMAPKFVTPYRLSGKHGKNDAADAVAICEAVSRPNMRFVPIKEEHQQIIVTLHCTRQGFVEELTATYNRIRGLMSEFGIVLPQKVAALRRNIGEHVEDLPGYANLCIGDLLAEAIRNVFLHDHVRCKHQSLASENRIRPSRALPPLQYCPGVKPIQATTCRPFLKS